MNKISFLFVILLCLFPLASVNSAQNDITSNLTAKEQRKTVKWQKKIERWTEKSTRSEESKSNVLPGISLGLGVLGVIAFAAAGGIGIILGLGALITGGLVFKNRSAYNKNGRLMGKIGLALGGAFLIIGILIGLFYLGIASEAFEGLYDHVLD